MALLNNHLDDIRIATGDAKVYKDESVYDYDTPVSADSISFDGRQLSCSPTNVFLLP